jgi:hypothetical protein
MSDKDLHERLDRLRNLALVIGGACSVLLVVEAFSSLQQFLRSYLFAYLFWVGLPLGCLGLLMLHHMVSGRWGYAIQRLLEASTRTLPLMAVLFLPVAFGMTRLFPWTDGTRENGVWHAYLNIPFFTARAIMFFCVWMTGGFLLTRWSRVQDESGDPDLLRRMRLLSAPGLVLYVLTVTFASVDWAMSLESGWYSTIYGFMFVVGQVLSSLALCIVVIRMIAPYEPFSKILTTRHVHHLGNLLLTFVILWAYLAYSQFIIIWSGNLPEENSWYLRRSGDWSVITVIVLVLHFFVPFFLLLSRRLKRVIRPLSLIAVGIFVMRVVDMYWLVMPSFAPEHIKIAWTDVLAPLAIGGFWCAAFARQLKNRPLLAQHDPRFAPAIEPAA